MDEGHRPDAGKRGVRTHLRSRYGDAALTPLSLPRTIRTPLATEAEQGAAGAILDKVGKAYETARDGGQYHGMYRRYRDEGTRQLEKSIRSFQALIREHEGWIADPFSKLPRTIDPVEVRRLVEIGWPDDIRRHRDSIDVLNGILQERRK